MIDEIYQLRKLNTYQIAAALRRQCDPDVAVIAAWWVTHNQHPKNWQQFMSLAQTKVLDLRMKKSTPYISNRIIDIIMKNYRMNKLKNLCQSLY